MGVESTRVGSIDTRGRTYDVFVHGQSFAVEFHGKMIHGESWNELDKKLKAAAAKHRIKISVPFVQIATDIGVRRGVATGIHGATGNVLIEWDDDGSKEQLSRNLLLIESLSDEDEKTFTRLVEEAQVATRRVQAWIDEQAPPPEGKYRWSSDRGFDLRGAVEKAIDVAEEERTDDGN